LWTREEGAREDVGRREEKKMFANQGKKRVQ